MARRLFASARGMKTRRGAHLAEVDLEHGPTALGVGQGDVDALLEAAAQCLVQVPGGVGGRQHHHR
eukprot:852469-Prorocentrum_minimum.AAC.1